MNIFTYLLLMATPTKKCPGCERILPRDFEHYYEDYDRPGHVRHGRCKECLRELNKKNKQSKGVQKVPAEDQRVYTEAYRFSSPEQKELLYDFMKTMGWTFSERNKLWWKKGVKSEEGRWRGAPRNPIKAGSHKLTKEERYFVAVNYDREDPNNDIEEYMSRFNTTESQVDLAIRVGRRYENNNIELELIKQKRGRKKKEGVCRNEAGKIIYEIENRTYQYRPRMTAKEKDEVMKLYNKGVPVKEIAEKFDRSEPGILYTIHNYGKK